MTPPTRLDDRRPLTPGRVGWRHLGFLTQLGPMIGLTLVVILFSILRFDTFARVDNVRIMLMQTAVVATAALGMTIIIISGGIDLSVGSTVALTGVVVGVLLRAGCPTIIAALGGAVFGCVCGAAIGLLVIGRQAEVFSAIAGITASVMLYTLAGWPMVIAALAGAVIWAGGTFLGVMFLPSEPLSPFIVTLGAWGALRGLAKGIADDQMVYPPHSTWLNALLRMHGPEENWIFVAPGVLVTVALAILVAGGLRYTRFGRHVFAIGSNEQTARLCGVPVNRNKVFIYVLGGLFGGLAGILQFSKLTEGDPTTAMGMELDVIAAVVIGGASLSGGQGSIFGTLVGALLMVVVANGCTKLSMPNWVQEIITGGIIVLAATIDRYQHRSAARRAG